MTNVNSWTHTQRPRKLNKEADQVRGNHKADQHLCFRYMNNTMPLFPSYTKFQASIYLLSMHRPVCVGPGRKPHCECFFDVKLANFFSVIHLNLKHFDTHVLRNVALLTEDNRCQFLLRIEFGSAYRNSWLATISCLLRVN